MVTSIQLPERTHSTPALDPEDLGSIPAQIGRRTILTAAAWSVPVLVSVGAVPAYAGSGSSFADTTVAFRAVSANYSLSGTLSGYSADLAFAGDVSFSTAALDADLAGRSFTYSVVTASLTMDDLVTYSVAPGTSSLGNVGSTHSIVSLKVPGVRIVDPGIIDGTVKHLRYPMRLSMVLNVADSASANILPVSFGWNISGRPTAIQGASSITYAGTMNSATI